MQNLDINQQIERLKQELANDGLGAARTKATSLADAASSATAQAEQDQALAKTATAVDTAFASTDTALNALIDASSTMHKHAQAVLHELQKGLGKADAALHALNQNVAATDAATQAVSDAVARDPFESAATTQKDTASAAKEVQKNVADLQQAHGSTQAAIVAAAKVTAAYSTTLEHLKAAAQEARALAQAAAGRAEQREKTASASTRAANSAESAADTADGELATLTREHSRNTARLAQYQSLLGKTG